MVSRDEDKYVVWPVYFDKSVSKLGGRKVSKKHAVEKPSLENIAKAAKSPWFTSYFGKKLCSSFEALEKRRKIVG